jgi:hypothetical protein
MSDGISRWYDDMDEWAAICESAGIKDVRWDCYSTEARHAAEGYRKKGLQGGDLKLYVQQAMERDHLKQKQAEEKAEYQLYLKLKKKYEPGE